MGISKVIHVIDLMDLVHECHKKIEQLSKGYRQRVGLACTLLHDPEVLILDEPTTGLDPNQLAQIRNLIKSIEKEKAVLLSIHIMQEVEAMCNRVIIINKVEIIAKKTLKEITKNQVQIIVVEFDSRVQDAFLKTLPHVNRIVNIHNFNYEITFAQDKDMRAKVFDFAKKHDLKILQLNQKNDSLEYLFRKLTS